MQRININDIKKQPENLRAENLVNGLGSPLSDILVDDEFKVMNGHVRLNAELDINGTATVRVASTGEQFQVRRDDDGLIVRADSTNVM